MSFRLTAAQATPYPASVPADWGITLVVAPHPDDESLGCGGAIALLRQHGQPVHVLFVSDGSMSHPNSQKYTRDARRDLREQEAENALALLGVSPPDITFLRLPDTQVPTPASTNFEEAATLIYHHIQRISPQTILVPWRRDPHGDHRATWQLLQDVVDRMDCPVRWIEYPIWVWESTEADDLPAVTDGRWYKLAISSVLSKKEAAIAAHVSQTTPLIDDDPEGFTLKPSMVSHFTQSYEYYLEP